MSDESLEAVGNVAIESEAPVSDKEVQYSDAVETTDTTATEPSVTVDDVKQEHVEAELTEADKVRAAMQKRIDQKHKLAMQKAEEVEALRVELEKYKPKQEDNAPKQEDYDDYDKWEADTISYKAEQLAQDRVNQQRQEEFARKQQELNAIKQRDFEAKVEEFRKQVPDYDVKAESFIKSVEVLKLEKGNNNPTLSALGQTLLELDNPPEVIAHLSDNDDLLFELANKTPIQAGIALVKLQLELQGKAKEQLNHKPEPIKPLKANGKHTKPKDDWTPDEVVAWVNGS